MRFSRVAPFLTILFLSVPTFSQEKRNCSYGTNELISILNVEDNTVDAIFNEPHVYLSGVKEVSILNASLGSILIPNFEVTEAETRILILTKQPEFSNIVDVDGITSTGSGPDGLKVTLEDDSFFICRITLTMVDTNNQQPTFSRPNLDVSIPRSWDKTVPINWKFEDAIQVFDDDLTDINAKVTITGDVISGGVRKREADQNHRHSYDVQLFVNDVISGPHEVFATDEVNRGSLIVNIDIVEENIDPPEFQNTGYFYVFEKIPDIGYELPLDIVATDPDNPTTDMTYSTDSDFLAYSDGKFRITSVDNLQDGEITITATEQIADAKNTIVKLNLKFPEVPPILTFKKSYYIIQYIDDWPGAEDIINNNLEAEVEGDGGEGVSFSRGAEMPSFIDVTGSVLKFVDDVTEDSLLMPNKISVFDVIVKDTASGREASATFLITFPITNPTTTTTSPPDSTTTNPPDSTTSSDCDCSTCTPSTDSSSSTTTENGSSSSTTDEPPEGTSCPPLPSTPEECTCPPTSTTTDPSSSTTDGGITCPPPTTTSGETCSPCPTTCPPPITCPPATTLEPCPTTPEDCSCDSCPTSSPTVCPPTTTTSGETCSPCPTTCPPPTTCPTTTTSTGTCAPCPTTCPTCPTTTTLESCECENSPSTCAPCDCDPTSTSTTSTCKPCPCDQDGDGEQEDCSNTGLLVAVVVTSVLCAASICAAGYLVWLLRKATIDPARIQRDNSFLIPKSNSINDVYKPDTTSPSDNYRFGNENPRMSFGKGGGGGISRIADTVPNEPGITNPSFSMDQPQPMPRRFSVPKANLPSSTTTTTHQPVASSVSPTIPADDSSIYSQPIKKSNIKSPKEIEPDYEERPIQPERKVSVKPDNSNRIKFAPEDEYISIDKDEAPGGGDGDANVDLDSDSEYERL